MAKKKIKIPQQVREGIRTALKPLSGLEERVREIVEKVQAQAIKPEDLSKALKDAGARLNKFRTEFEKSFNDGVAQVMSALNLATRSEVAALSKKVDGLARELKKLQPKKAAAKKAKK